VERVAGERPGEKIIDITLMQGPLRSRYFLPIFNGRGG
jgi:hypothetical protein